MGFRTWFAKRSRGKPRLSCAVVTPIGPGHAELYGECRASTEAAWRTGRGPFSALQIVPVDDAAGRLGRSRARNQGVREASAGAADWIFFLDADDLMHAEAFANLGDLVARYDAVWGLITSQGKDEAEPRLRFPQVLNLDSLEQLVMFDPAVTLQMGHFVRTPVALENPFDEPLDAGEDFDYYLRLWRRYRCVKVPRMFFLNRRGRQSSGPRAGSPEHWGEVARGRLRAERERLNLDSAAEQAVAITNRSAAELHAFCRQHGLADAASYLSLSRQVPYRGLHHIADYAGESFVMFSDNDDLVCASLAWTGEYEYVSSRLWQGLARDAQVILDVGAYTGLYSLLAARANPPAQIYCFEPVARNYERILRNLQLSGCTQVHALHAAASNRDGRAAINVFGGGDFLTSGASLDPLHEIVRTETVTLVTLDRFLESNQCGKAGLVKLDVEGHEVEVLEGMRESIAAHRPDLIIEITVAGRAAAVERLLRVHGYAFYGISDAHYRVEPLAGLRASDAADRNCLATVRPASEVERVVDEALRAPR